MERADLYETDNVCAVGSRTWNTAYSLALSDTIALIRNLADNSPENIVKTLEAIRELRVG